MAEPVQSADERSESARAKEDNDCCYGENNLDEGAAEKIEELAEESEHTMSPFVHEQVDSVNNPDDERHVVPAVRCLIISRKVIGIIANDDEDDDFEGYPGFFHNYFIMREEPLLSPKRLSECREQTIVSQFLDLGTATFAEFLHLSCERLIVRAGVLTYGTNL